MEASDESLIAEINDCQYLFLREISEPVDNALRLAVEEALASPETVSLDIAGTEIVGAHPVESNSDCRLFELLWDSYIAYSVRNESFAARRDDEICSGRLFRIYAKSYFLEFVSHATFASAEYPGPFRHYQVACEDHVIDIVSTNGPRIRQLRPARDSMSSLGVH